MLLFILQIQLYKLCKSFSHFFQQNSVLQTNLFPRFFHHKIFCNNLFLQTAEQDFVRTMYNNVLMVNYAAIQFCEFSFVAKITGLQKLIDLQYLVML